MRRVYETENVCAQLIAFDIEGSTISNIEFFGGCNGNLKAVAKLLEGASVEHIEQRLLGTTCGRRSTSCPDQLARAVRKAYEESLRD